MKYLYNVQSCLTITFAIAALIMLGRAARVKGKGLLLIFIITQMLVLVGNYVPYTLLHNNVISPGAYMTFIKPASVFYLIMGMIGWAMLLAFIAGLKSMQQTVDD